MFTGIIEEVGSIRRIDPVSDHAVIVIAAKTVLEGTNIGDSIDVDGVCLTVTEIGSDHFSADAMPETVRRSTLGTLEVGSSVNLERALRLDSRLGGHLVSGHIDGLGTVSSIERDENAIWFKIATAQDLLRYIVEKGSIAINGVSLTVVGVDGTSFTVSIIPHTFESTDLSTCTVGSKVNLECDILAKYVEKLVLSEDLTGNTAAPTRADNGDSRLTESFLLENGF